MNGKKSWKKVRSNPILNVTGENMNGKKFDPDSYSRYYVHDYNSNSRLIGAPSRILIEESLAEPGAVLAYLAEDGLWHYVRPDIASSIREEGLEVRKVYVYVDPI